MIDGLFFTSDGSPIVDHHFILSGGYPVNITNTQFYDITMDYYPLFESYGGSGFYWENNYFRNVVPPSKTNWAILLANGFTDWTLVNQTFENVPPQGSTGIISISSGSSGSAPGDSTITFGGNISFINCVSPTLSAMTAAIPNIFSDFAIHIKSLESNPSRFILRDSDLSLFFYQAYNQLPGAQISIEVGSIDVDTSIVEENEYERFIFQCDLYDYEYAGGYSNPNITATITVLGDIVSNGMGIASRGYGNAGLPSNLAINTWLKIGGSLNYTINGDVSTAFRLTWPMDIYADSINGNHVPRASDGLVPTFVTFQPDQFSSSSAHVTFDVTHDMIITSSNTPFELSEVTSPSPASTPVPILPHSTVAPIYLNTPNLTLNITVGSLVISNFSLPRDANTHFGAAIAVLRSTLNITTTDGDVVFFGNQNVGGNGGALYVASDAPGMTVHTPNTRGIVFNANVAAYGGAIYVDPVATSGDLVSFSSAAILLFNNIALYGGGAVVLPHAYVETLFPASKTVLSGNGAGEFGCVFAFGSSPSSSDVGDSTCSSGAYEATEESNSWRLIPSYQNATYCGQYEALCTNLPIPPSPPVSPTASPIPVPTNPTPAPAATPVPVTTGCVPTTNLPPGSYCENGVYRTDSQSFIDYINNGTSTKPAVVDAPVFISGGNVTILSLTLGNVLSLANGIAMLSSNNCISVSTVSVSMSPGDIDKITSSKSTSALLIQSSCSPDTSSLVVTGSKPKKSCQRLNTVPKNTPNSLQASFTLSSSKCDLWWIVLVSVLGGVLVLVAVTVVVVLLLPDEYRSKLQPFHKSKDSASSGRPSAYSNVKDKDEHDL